MHGVCVYARICNKNTKKKVIKNAWLEMMNLYTQVFSVIFDWNYLNDAIKIVKYTKKFDEKSADKRKIFNKTSNLCKNEINSPFFYLFALSQLFPCAECIKFYYIWKIMNEHYISFHKEYNGLWIISFEKTKKQANTMCIPK